MAFTLGIYVPFFPVEKPGPEDQRQSCRIAQAARPDLVIPVVSQLLT